VHFDKSARIQTVDLNDNNRLWKILKNFEKLTNFPILLNTSFNVNGEPMVLNPDDAITTFFNSGLEVLVLNEFIIKKR
jgi:carbamoyltransferase